MSSDVERILATIATCSEEEHARLFERLVGEEDSHLHLTFEMTMPLATHRADLTALYSCGIM